MLQIDGEVRIEELVDALPAAVRILADHGIVCIRCGEPYWGTLAELAAEKGVRNLAPVLEDLRRAAGAPAPDGDR